MIPGLTKENMNRLIRRFATERFSPRGTAFFEQLIFAWLFIHGLWFFDIRELLWGPDSLLMTPNTGQGIIPNLFYRLSYNPGESGLTYFAHLAFAFVVLTGVIRRAFVFHNLLKFGAYLTGYMLYYAAWPNFSSALLLVLNYAFLSIFFVHGEHQWKIVLSNFARLACILLLIMVYVESSLYKLMGPKWLDGTAVYYALNLPEYSTTWSRSLADNSVVVAIMTYSALAYQLLFPLLVWIRKVKIPFLLIGVGFHMFIAAGMNLWDFGPAMLIGYVLFLNETQVSKLNLASVFARRSKATS